MKDALNERYRSDKEVEEVVRRFESCELPPSAFGHREHLMVALCYLLRMSEEDALERVRTHLGSYVRAHNINPNLYHETLTVFWLKRVRAFIVSACVGLTKAELANHLAGECGNARLVFSYYSKELIDSEGARREWTEPDLRPLDF
ncbi:MAG: hypothetical protein QOJ70_1918 [Acidobacteriota bacterium]|jgi:N-formylglutamate deformylase|nr:hypothetical protein [Acidobacteriota bacterium]